MIRATILALGLTLAACTAQQQAQVQTDAAKAQQVAQTAINFWGVAKGVGLVAEVSDPRLKPAIDAVIAAVDPKVAKAQAALNAASADVPLLLDLAATIRAQAEAVLAQGAPAVRVVPG